MAALRHGVKRMEYRVFRKLGVEQLADPLTKRGADVIRLRDVFSEAERHIFLQRKQSENAKSPLIGHIEWNKLLNLADFKKY